MVKKIKWRVAGSTTRYFGANGAFKLKAMRGQTCDAKAFLDNAIYLFIEALLYVS